MCKLSGEALQSICLPAEAVGKSECSHDVSRVFVRSWQQVQVATL